MKAIGVAPGLATFLYNSCKYALKSLTLKLPLTVNYSISVPVINAANFDKDYLPEPPTPINKAFPTGKSKILAILQT